MAAKYSTGAPTEDNPIIYNVPGSDAEEKKETEDLTKDCVDHRKLKWLNKFFVYNFILF